MAEGLAEGLELFSEGDKAGNTLGAVEKGGSAAGLFDESAFDESKFNNFKSVTEKNRSNFKIEGDLGSHMQEVFKSAERPPPEITNLINEYKRVDGQLKKYLTGLNSVAEERNMAFNISTLLNISIRGPDNAAEMGSFILRMGPLMEKDPKIFRAVLDEFLESGGVAGVEGFLQGDKQLIEMIAKEAPVLSEGRTVEAEGSKLRDIANCAGIYGSELTEAKYGVAKDMLRTDNSSKIFRGANPPITSMEELKNAAKKEPPFGLKTFSETSPGKALDDMKNIHDLKGDEQLLEIVKASKLTETTGKTAEELKALLKEDESIFQSFQRLEREGNEGKILRKFSNAIKMIWNKKITKFLLAAALMDASGFIHCKYKELKDDNYNCQVPSPDHVTPPGGAGGPDALLPECGHLDRKASDGITDGEWPEICSDNVIHTGVDKGQRILCSPPSPNPSFIFNPEFNDCDTCLDYYLAEPSTIQMILYYIDIDYFTELFLEDKTKSYYSMLDKCNVTVDYAEKIDDIIFSDTLILIILCVLLFFMPIIAAVISVIIPFFIFISAPIGIMIQISLIHPIINYKKKVENDSADYKKNIKDLLKSPDFSNIDVNNELDAFQLTSIINEILTIGESEDDNKNKMISMVSFTTIIVTIFVSNILFFIISYLIYKRYKRGGNSNNDAAASASAASAPAASAPAASAPAASAPAASAPAASAPAVRYVNPMTGGQRGGKRNILSKTLNKFNRWLIIFLLILAILINYFYNSNRSNMYKKKYLHDMRSSPRQEMKRSFNKNIQVKEENKNLSYEPSIVFGGQFI